MGRTPLSHTQRRFQARWVVYSRLNIDEIPHLFSTDFLLVHPSGLSNLPSLLVLSSTPSVRQIAWHTLTNVNEQRTPPHLKLSPLHKEGKPILDSILFLTTKKRWQNSHKVRIDLRFLFILLTQLKVSTSLGYQFEHLAMSYVDICMDGRI